MNVATGEVLTGLNKGHTGGDVLRSFKQIDATVPRGLAVHVLDNRSAHSTPEIKKWLAHRDGRRWHLHFTPTSSFWLDLIERWFELTDRRPRLGGSVVRSIDIFGSVSSSGVKPSSSDRSI